MNIKKSILFYLLAIIINSGCKFDNLPPKLISEDVFNQQLELAVQYIKGECGRDGIDKMVILREGNCIFSGKDHDKSQKIWSSTKSFTSTVLGLLIDDGKCQIDDKVCKYLPELSENYPDLTFKHLATMTSGYRAIGDEPRGSYIHGPSYTPWLPSPEPLFPPGSEFRYWDSAMNLFSYALTVVSGERLDLYFKRKIADKIGMDSLNWKWPYFLIDSLQVCGGAGNNNWSLIISADDLSKFGQLFLQKGMWNEEQLISEKWIKNATSDQIKSILQTDTIHYGYNWWTNGVFPDAPEETFCAMGFNNNKCLVVPEWKIVVARLGLDGNIDNLKWNQFIKILGEAYE